MTRVCTRCKIDQPLKEFYKRKDTAKGVRPWCKTCCKEVRRQSKTTPEKKQRQHLLHRYSLTVEEYELLLELQDYGCAICGSKDSGAKGKKHLAVDHDHETGKIRGLLCNSCNNGLGRFKDNPNLLNKAYHYLKTHKED